MLANTTLLRILGACFYYPPQSSTFENIIPVLPELAELNNWPDSQHINSLLQSMGQYTPEQLSYDFSVLFEGQGEMPAPPWGSVYLDHENIVMGESTLLYREFLASHGLVSNSYLNEPEDQFGLMLLAITALYEQNKPDAVLTLLEQHLLPWAYRYLTLVEMSHVENTFYPQLATITKIYLAQLQQQLNITPLTVELFR
ncbi:TorD/DmsD family molecular chaperone [Moellerella wisconsensis]|uniref:Putative anaerobic dehydrogenase oxidoreductase component n=1 Tax=Moellerella wisconsensis ATCC 35017 TaxID=1354267 RepID=A0A0N0I9V3_9GAMM|nr:molecular chaperone [Moellerella wisconsensis]KPD02503.1 putative anaerobic dehydrogenase oxidoreductase component [Moellerella wisconsensis ATCC 35017]VFS48365.1 Twin-arginine leader-binding protein DmsD [Moellerella wisconsensis]